MVQLLGKYYSFGCAFKWMVMVNFVFRIYKRATLVSQLTAGEYAIKIYV